MNKRIVAIALLLIITISLSACGFIPDIENNFNDYIEEKVGVHPDNYRKVDYAYDEERETYYLIYQNERYYSNENYNMFDIDYSEENFVDLGWHFNLPFTVYAQYFSYSDESPDYIFPMRRDLVYFKEGVDYTNEVLVVDGTEIEFKYSEIWTSKTTQNVGGHNTSDSIILRFKNYPAISFKAKLVDSYGVWYIYIFNMDFNFAYRVSDDFHDALIENGIVPY